MRLFPSFPSCGTRTWQRGSVSPQLFDQVARWAWTSLSRSVVDSYIEGYSPYQRWFPALSISTKLCPGRSACMPLPMVP